MIFRCKHCGDLSRDEYLACEQPDCDVEKIGSAPVPLSEALGSAGRSAAQEGSPDLVQE